MEIRQSCFSVFFFFNAKYDKQKERCRVVRTIQNMGKTEIDSESSRLQPMSQRKILKQQQI